MFRIGKIQYSDHGKTILYQYEVDGAVAKFFHKKEKLFASYDLSVEDVPESIAIIPLLANVMPIAWFAGFEVYADEVDADFYKALEKIRMEMAKHHPNMAAPTTRLHFKKLIKNNIPNQNTAMLFSGGVDAFATYFRHFDENPELVTIQGADIELTDSKQWEDVKNFNENEPILAHNRKHYIRSNFQKFYTYNVDLLLPNLGWWGNIQHGLALICSLAPLAYVRNFGTIYIASTRSSHMEFNPWGSMPEIDEQISWGGNKIIHDGFELKRQDKVDAIVAAVNQRKAKTTIRVCYSELKDSMNCSKCEKCIRTMFGIMLAGDNPNDYGFQADASIYDSIQSAVGNGFRSKGTQFFWKEIMEKAAGSKELFVFADAAKEAGRRDETLKVIDANCRRELVKASGTRKMKHVLINKYPKAFQYYLKLRRSF